MLWRQSPILEEQMLKLRFFLLILAAPLLGKLNQNNDVQVWVTESVHKKFSPALLFELTNEWRVGDNVSKLYFFYLEGMLQIKAARWLDVGPGYRQIWNIAGNQWKLTYFPYWEFDFHKTNGRAGFYNRNRFVYVMPEGGQNYWEYRGRIRWMTTYEIKHRLCRPYISNEVFVNTSASFSQDRLMAGLIVPLTHSLNGDFYFMVRFLKSNHHWTHQNVFGTWMNLIF
jgi:hypothetical protein